MTSNRLAETASLLFLAAVILVRAMLTGKPFGEMRPRWRKP